MSNKVSQIINLRKQAQDASKKDKIKLYPKIHKLMQQLSQREWEHPIVKSLDKFFTGTKGGKWYAKQAERPARTPRPVSRQPTGPSQRSPQKFDGSWGPGALPIMAKVGHEDVAPYIVGKNGRPLSDEQMPLAQQRKVLKDLNDVGYTGPFVVNSGKRSFKELFNLMKGRKSKHFNFLNLENSTINNIVESFLMRTDMGNYYRGVDNMSKPWKHSTYTNEVGQDLSIPPALRYRGNNWIQDLK